MTPSEEYTERYKVIKLHADALGRVIGVRRLKPSQQVKLSELTPALEGDAEMTDEDGRVTRVPRRLIPVIAASVCKIDDVMVSFPRSRGELDSIMDKLDTEGLMAAVQAYGELTQTMRPVEPAEGQGDADDDGDPTIASAKK